MAKKTKREKIPLGVQQEFSDIDYWKTLIKSKETVTLKDGTVLTMYEYMKKFMQESYGNGFSRKKPDSNILQTEDQKKWARRNNNNTNRDAFNVGRKTERITINDRLLERHNRPKNEPWENTFKTGTFEQALDQLIELTADELGYPADKQTKVGLIRFYFRIKRFLKLLNKDLKNENI